MVLRVGLALTVGLGVDESYSLANARDLSLSYFDHPPLHLWIAHASGILLGYGRLARLPFIVMFAGTTWMMFRSTERLFGSAAGVWAALALNLAGFFTVAAGEWILPDGPLMFCLAGSAARSLCAPLAKTLSPPLSGAIKKKSDCTTRWFAQRGGISSIRFLPNGLLANTLLGAASHGRFFVPADASNGHLEVL